MNRNVTIQHKRLIVPICVWSKWYHQLEIKYLIHKETKNWFESMDDAEIFKSSLGSFLHFLCHEIGESE